jgi:hypothetical protein
VAALAAVLSLFSVSGRMRNARGILLRLLSNLARLRIVGDPSARQLCLPQVSLDSGLSYPRDNDSTDLGIAGYYDRVIEMQSDSMSQGHTAQQELQAYGPRQGESAGA